MYINDGLVPHRILNIVVEKKSKIRKIKEFCDPSMMNNIYIYTKYNIYTKYITLHIKITYVKMFPDVSVSENLSMSMSQSLLVV